MKRSIPLLNEAQLIKDLRKLGRRILGITVLAASVFVAPAIASMNPEPFNKARVPNIDSRAIETVLRWVEQEEESRTVEV